jgi:hypothetical protein
MMTKYDTMTSEERLAALRRGSTVDRVPFLSFILDVFRPG